MASTVNKSKLTVILREEVKLKNQTYGNRTEIEINSINEVSQRIISVPTADTTTLIKLSGSVGAGTYAMDNLKYGRVTNLDNKNYVRLSFISGSAGGTDYNRYDVRLDARQSYIFSNSKLSGSDSGDSFGSFVDFTDLKAKANTAAVDVELFVAST